MTPLRSTPCTSRSRRAPLLPRAPFVPLVLLAAVALVACGEDPTDEGEPRSSIDCGTEVTSLDVDVRTSDESVVFDWSPRCRIALLLVEPVNSGSDMWAFGSEDANVVEPPITYGLAPDSLEHLWEPAQPLQAGESYEVILWHLVGTTERLLAVQTFTR